MMAGIDEAGRGPVLGPLVVAAVLLDVPHALAHLDVKDSKKLTPARREALAPRIRETARRVELRVIHADELNARMPHETLNQIETHAFAELLDRLRPHEAILDACDVNADRFGRHVAAHLQHPCTLRAEHEADAHHPIVAAASILAKVERDHHMARLAARHGPCGSGYPADPTTKTFLREWVDREGRLPPFARAHWQTARRLLPPNRTLLDF